MARLSVYILKKDKNRYILIKTLDCSAGAEKTPTLRGYFKMKYKVNKFYNQKYKAGAMYGLVYSGNYLLHSAAINQKVEIIDNAIIKRNTHGCIRVNMNDSKWLYWTVPIGTEIWVN